ncbi:uncharacterized protein sb:cb1058 [Dunckerocampus dactyliophorus]|uniref:uncharacterized protein sb:cb1058 n=1 Tax=Dunckerocampus dactyliophorus TaxID=161453 RepID=UPI0024067D76|nr:uncharacterized protein sb:cb1058 [Dunckerocampus dactyliophorus]
MTIGKNSRKGSLRGSIRAPKFLDKSSGFYGRLEEPVRAPLEAAFMGEDVMEEVDVVRVSETDEVEDMQVFVPMEDDGQMLLRATPSRWSSGRWRRSSRRRHKQRSSQEESPRDEMPDLGTASQVEPHIMKVAVKEENLPVHLMCREDADDQVLIRDKTRMKREKEEGMKVVKRNTMKMYSKALDGAFRRGWEAFVANIYSITLTPVNLSSSPSSKKKHQHNLVLAEFQ